MNAASAPAGWSRRAAALRLGAVAAALVVVAVLIFSVSRAAFTATTENAGNSVSTGTVTLTDDDADTAMFNNITNLAPSATTARCIHVDYTGSLDPTAIKLYISAAPTGTLAQYLNLTVEIGADNADAFSSCSSFTPTSTLFTGTLASFASTHTNFANGLTTWDPSTTDSRTFRFTLQVQDVSAAAGLTAGWGFTWETRSS
jgi:hypothetical protein